MIQSLSANGQDKDVWHKDTNSWDVIVNLLHDDSILTLETASAVMKRDETYLSEILELKPELVELKSDQETVTTTEGQGTAHRIHNNHHRDGGTHTTDKVIRKEMIKDLWEFLSQFFPYRAKKSH